MVLEGPPRWPGVAIETPTQEATASRAPSLHFIDKMVIKIVR